MNFLNKLKSVLGFSAPQATSTTGNGGYRLGRLDAATRRNVPGFRSGDTAVAERGELMHQRTRDGYLNVPLTKRSTDALRDLVVGCGIQAFADPIDYSFGWSLSRRSERDLMDSLDYALESDEKFIAWASEPAHFDVAGRLNFWEAQGMTITENVLVGQTIWLRVNSRGPGSPIPLRYQLIESEQIDMTKDRPAGPWGNRIVGGFEFSDDGREVGCWIYEAHPYDNAARFSTKSTFVPAWRYLHPFKSIRPSQGIGASWLHAQGQPSIDRDKWFEAELRSAVKAALHVLVAKLENPNGVSLGAEPNDMNDATIAMGTNPLATAIRKGEEISIVESNRPNPNAQPFFSMLDHDLAAAANLSYYTLTGKFHEANFGGFKGALALESCQMEVIAQWLGKAVVMPVRREWNRIAAAIGHFESLSPAAFAAEQTRFSRYDIIGAGRFLIDADNETKADMSELRGGLSTLKIECASRNLHWIKVLRQIALENRLCEALGVRLDHGSGGGGNNSENTRSQPTGEPTTRR